MNDDDLLTVSEVAIILRRSDAFVLRELRRKNLRGIKYGGGWSIERRDLNAYKSAHANVTPVRRAS